MKFVHHKEEEEEEEEDCDHGISLIMCFMMRNDLIWVQLFKSQT